MSKLRCTSQLLLIALTCSIVSTSAQGPAGRSFVVQSIDSPAAPGSGEPNLYTTADGRVLLSWIEAAGEKGQRLRFSVRNGDKWSEPRTIAEGNNWFINWADFPSVVALPNGFLVAHWLVKGTGNSHAYDINISRSTDSGKTWSKPIVPHRDGTQSEHGFVSMLPWNDNGTGILWLDGRKFTPKEHGRSDHSSSADEMSLRFTTLGSGGQLSDDVLLDSRVCDCCQTSAAMTSEGAVVVYRDRSEKEVRDISIMRFRNGRWTEPQPVGADGWEIHGCPVNGPTVVAEGKRVAVAWFTAANDSPRVNVAFSNDAGATFSQPARVDDGSPMGRAQVVLLPDGSALVSWMERASKGAEIRVRRIHPSGVRDQAILVAESSSARSSGFPRMVRVGDRVVFAWTEPANPPRVRAAVGTLVNVK